ncbi:MAG: bacterioferritin-associated ferredoxin [Chitinivorax sp.]
MYVCLCHAVTDRQIRDAVVNGCDSMRDLRNELGVATQCGRCACHARDLLNHTLLQIAEPIGAAA